MTKKELARRVYDLSHLTGTFTLRSGQLSTEYFDKYLFEADPEVLLEVARHLAELVPEGTEVIAGLEMGGIPLATMISQFTGLPTAFVRKTAKEYGTAKVAEGASPEGKRVVVIEDVVTSGGQIILSARDLRDAGAHLETVLCVIDRQAGGAEKLQENYLELRSLFTMEELKAAAADAGE